MEFPLRKASAVSIPKSNARLGGLAQFFLPVIVAVLIGILLFSTGAAVSGSFAIAIVCGLAVLIRKYPLTGYYLLLCLVLLADYSEWNFQAWTHTLGFYVYQNWWKLISRTEVRDFGWLICNTVDILLLAVFFGWATGQKTNIRRFFNSPVALLTLVYMSAFACMFAYGLLTGGNIRAALWQIRPYFHFAAVALLGMQLLQSKAHIRVVIWLILSVIAIKSGQIVWLFFVQAGGSFGDWREILGHEDSIFIAGTLGLFAAFTLYKSGDRQKLFLLIVLPVLFLALVLNLRRAGYVALAFIFMLMPIVLHGRREIAVKLALLFLVIGISYTFLFWDTQGLIGIPAQKVKSILFAATESVDHSSNFYRLAENVNLRRTITAHPLGIGFGHPFELHVPLADISSLLPNWQYHPHNMILGMWMTLGTPCFAVFIFYHASVLMLAGFYMRRLADPYLKATCFFALATYAAGFLVASVDQFIWSERGAIFMGLLVALLASMGRLEGKDLAR